MTAPLVSILIPAFRPDWLDVAIASALAQTHGRVELLIGDDSAGDAVESVVSKWRDGRLRYSRNPTARAPGSNRDYLLSLAQGEYIKFLFDDDLLLPNSVELLLAAAQSTGSPLAFHHRDVVDEHGVVVGRPRPNRIAGQPLVTPALFFETSVGELANIIGEPTNILIQAESLRAIEAPFALEGSRMRFLTDMALYTNFAGRGHAMAHVESVGSAFRRHGGQTSNALNPSFSSGLFEWELLRRWAVDAGQMSVARFDSGNKRQFRHYKAWVGRYPELAAFIALGGKPDNGRYMSHSFRAALAQAYAAIEARRAGSPAEAAPKPKRSFFGLLRPRPKPAGPHAGSGGSTPAR